MIAVDQVRRAPLADQAADLLLGRIRTGEWTLGEKLPGETTLAPQLGVGRSTVREAIRQLAGQGVLAPRQGVGVFVTALDVPDDWETVLRHSSIVAVIEARMAIETEGAMLAATRRTATDLRVIRRALARRTDESPDIAVRVDLDTRFHRTVMTASHNPVLVELFDSFTPRVRQAMIEMLRIRVDFDAAEDQAVHQELTEAISVRDPARAGEVSRAHLAALREALG